MGQSALNLSTDVVPTIGKLVQMFQCFIFYDKNKLKIKSKICASLH